MRFTAAAVCLTAATVNAFNLNGEFECRVKRRPRADVRVHGIHGYLFVVYRRLVRFT